MSLTHDQVLFSVEQIEHGDPPFGVPMAKLVSHVIGPDFVSYPRQCAARVCTTVAVGVT